MFKSPVITAAVVVLLKETVYPNHFFDTLFNILLQRPNTYFMLFFQT